MAIMITGCSDFKETLGLERPTPDEFRVVSRAPLTVPPEFGLRPPAPGSVKSGDAPQQQAEKSLFGQNAAKPSKPASSGEEKLLQLTGGNNADPSIKATVDRETAQLAEANKTLMDKIRTYEPPATLVDAAKEKERLEKNKAEGLPANAGDVPMIKPKKKGLF